MHGIIQQGELIVVSKTHPNAKLVVYENVPEFDQTTHYVVQRTPADAGDHIYMGVELRELQNIDEPIDTDLGMGEVG